MPVTISYPTAGDVPGGGAFYTWGTTDGECPGGIDAMVIFEPTPFPGADAPPPPPPCTWSFRFEGLPVGVPGKLIVRCLDAEGGEMDSSNVDITCVPPP